MSADLWADRDIPNMINQMRLESSPQPPRQLKAISMGWQIQNLATDQYNRLYVHRISTLSPRVPICHPVRVEALGESRESVGIVGMLKRLEKKRIRAFEKEYLAYYRNCAKIYSQEDELELEDISGRIKVKFGKREVWAWGRKLTAADLPYGVVVGLIGRYSARDNKFLIQQVVFPTLPPQPPISKPEQGSDKLLVLNQVGLADLTHILGFITEREDLAGWQFRAVVAVGVVEGLIGPELDELERVLARFAPYISIFVVPSFSPTSLSKELPLKPCHPVLLGNSANLVHRCSNPQILQIEEKRILIEDGLYLADIRRNCSLGPSDLDLMHAQLHFNHLIPTSPFSLRCDIVSEDPFLLFDTPHLMLASGCQAFQMAELETSSGCTRLATLDRGRCITVNMNSLEIGLFMADARL